MSAVQTTQLGIDMQIEWQEPDSGSLSIEGYLIEILANDGSFKTSMDTCNGHEQIWLNNLFCVIPIKTLTEQPFDIPQGDLIKVRVSAMNSLGYSVPSLLNTEGVRA